MKPMESHYLRSKGEKIRSGELYNVTRKHYFTVNTTKFMVKHTGIKSIVIFAICRIFLIKILQF